MPRNGSSIYSLPAGNPVIPGTVIATAWANSTLSDIATALTNSLSTDGSTASVSLANKILVGGTLNGPTITGNLTLTGGQITFPAVQSASANVNCLDDYEEGTFTPSISYATPGNLVVNYSTRSGTYTKIGRYVWMNFAMVTTTYTHTTAAGTMIITGAPFTPVSDGKVLLPTRACSSAPARTMPRPFSVFRVALPPPPLQRRASTATPKWILTRPATRPVLT